MSKQQYLLEVDLSWYGSTVCHTETISIHTDDVSDEAIRKFVFDHYLPFAQRYAFDCGDLNHPLFPRIGNIRYTPVETTQYCYYNFEEEQNRIRLYIEYLIRTKQQFIDGRYNKADPPSGWQPRMCMDCAIDRHKSVVLVPDGHHMICQNCGKEYEDET
jgi:hypothetical protein